MRDIFLLSLLRSFKKTEKMSFQLKIFEQKHNLDFDRKVIETLPLSIGEAWERTTFSSFEIFPKRMRRKVRTLLKEFHMVIGGRVASDVGKIACGGRLKHKFPLSERSQNEAFTLYCLIPQRLDLYKSLAKFDPRLFKTAPKTKWGVKKGNLKIHLVEMTLTGKDCYFPREMWAIFIEINDELYENCINCPMTYILACQQHLTQPEVRVITENKFYNDAEFWAELARSVHEDKYYARFEPWVELIEATAAADDIGFFGIPDAKAERIVFVKLGLRTPLLGMKITKELHSHRCFCGGNNCCPTCTFHVEKRKDTRLSLEGWSVKESECDSGCFYTHTIRDTSTIEVEVSPAELKRLAKRALNEEFRRRGRREKPINDRGCAFLSYLLRDFGIKEKAENLRAEKWTFY